MYSLKGNALFRTTVIKTTVIVLLCGILVAAALVVFSEPLMGLYGRSFSDRSEVLIILAVTYSIAVITMEFGAAFTAADHNWLQLLQKGLWGLAMVSAAYVLSDKGALGLAYAYAFGNGVFVMIQLAAISRLLRRP
jgi:Na+-driven multidrug efflux pump